MSNSSKFLFVKKHKEAKKSKTPPKRCHVGIHYKTQSEHSQMRTHVPGFSSFSMFFLYHFVLANLATSSIRINQACSLDDLLLIYSNQRCFTSFENHNLERRSSTCWVFTTTVTTENSAGSDFYRQQLCLMSNFQSHTQSLVLCRCHAGAL